MSEGEPLRPGRFRWRRWNAVLHRDAGYLVAGLTVVYAVSGIAVNHVEDWNPSYRFERVEERFEPFAPTDRAEMAARLVRILKLPGPPMDAFRARPHEIELFYDGWSVKADVLAGTAVVERPRERPLLFDANFLHLNHAKGAWTAVADAYAATLIFLSCSGLLMLRGRKGLGGRGKWLVAAGLAVPAAFVAVRYFS